MNGSPEQLLAYEAGRILMAGAESETVGECYRVVHNHWETIQRATLAFCPYSQVPKCFTFSAN